MGPRLGRPQYRLLLTLITVVTALVSLCWALLSPAYRPPDELAHANSVVRVAHGGGWPAPGDARISSGMLRAWDQAAGRSHLPGSTLPSNGTEFVDVPPVPDQDRIRIDASNALDVAGSPRVDQMTQHPPLYYGVAALALRVLGAQNGRWDRQLLLLRLLSVALVISVVPLLASLVHRTTGSPAVALAAALVPLAVPQFGHITGSVTNDVLLVLLGTITLVLCGRVLAGDARVLTAVLVGLFLGLALLTKGFAVLAIPWVALAFFVMRGHLGLGARTLRAGVSMLVAFAVGGWWWAHNLLVEGQLQPNGFPLPASAPNPSIPRDLPYFLRQAAAELSGSFWGRFEALEIRMPGSFTDTATIVLAILMAVAVAGTLRRREWAREVLVLGGFALTLLVALTWHDYLGFRVTGHLAGLQGRYFYMAISGIALLAVLGLLTLLGGSTARLRAVLPVLTAAACGASCLGLAVGFLGSYRGPGEPLADAWHRWVAWSPATGGALAVALVITCCAMALLVVASGVLVWRVRLQREAAPAAEPITA